VLRRVSSGHRRRFLAVAGALLVLSSTLLAGALSAPATLRPFADANGTQPAASAARVASGGSEGVVLSTEDLVDNVSTPGAVQPTSQDTPTSAVFDPVNGEVYVRGYIGTSITVLDSATNRAIEEIGVPASQVLDSPAVTLAVDTSTGFVYTTNAQEGNVSVIDGATNTVVGAIPVGGAPNGIAYDPDNGYLYVTKWYSAQVAIVNPANDEVLGNLTVGSEPGAILYDGASQEVFVANFDSANVSIINATDGTVVSNNQTGPYPVALALDTASDTVAVANSESSPGWVTLLSARAPYTAQNVSVGLFPDAVAYAPSSNQLFVGNSADNNVSVIDLADDHTVASPDLVTPGTYFAVYDAVSGDVDLLNSAAYNVTLLNATTDREVGSVNLNNDEATGIVVDSANGDVYAISEGSFLTPGQPPHAQANATVISGASGRAIASIPLNVYPTGVTYDPVTNQVLVEDPAGNDTYLLDPATGTIEGTVAVNLEPESAAVDPTNGEVYTVGFAETFPYIGEVTVLNAPLHVVKNITTGYSPTGITFDPSTGCFYVSDDLSGNIAILNATTNTFVANVSVGPSADLAAIGYDAHNGEVYVADLGNGTVAAIDPATRSVVGWMTVGLEPTTLAFDPTNGTVFVGNAESGNISVINDTTNRGVASLPLAYSNAIVYDGANNLLYDVGGESGDLGTYNATTYASGGPPLYLGSGVYPHAIGYDPADARVFVSTKFQGTVSVVGTPAAAPPKYPVTATETGLPTGTTWAVTLNGTENSSTSSSIGFSEPNGTYPYTVAPVPGYAAHPAGGTQPVSGGPAGLSITFTPSATGAKFNVTFAETGLPSGTRWSVSIGTLVEVVGGGPDHVVALENGSYEFTIGNVSGYSVAPESGPLTVAGHDFTVNVTFTSLTGVPPSTSSSPSGLPPWVWVALGVGLAALLLIVFLLARRRKREPEPTASPGPQPPPKGPAPPFPPGPPTG
jgi:YVTN family beta-propeller protein